MAITKLEKKSGKTAMNRKDLVSKKNRKGFIIFGPCMNVMLIVHNIDCQLINNDVLELF